MTESQKYEGYSWIKVKRAGSICAGALAKDIKVVEESHHIEETSFLIKEIRKLATRIDELTMEKNNGSQSQTI